VTGGHDNSVRVRDLAGRTPAVVLLDHGSAVRWASYDREGTRLITAGSNGILRFWERTGEALHGILRHGSDVSHAEISPDGDRAISVSLHGGARVWDALTGKLAVELAGSNGILHAAFSPDSRRIATAHRDGTAFVWLAQTGERLAGLLSHKGAVNHVAFSPDGRKVVTASSDETAGLWDTTASGLAPIFLKHTADVVSAEISPDGRLVATASADATARVWDAATGAPLTAPLRHQSHVHRASFSPDSRFLVTASADGGARVWDARTGELITPAIRHGGPVLHAAFSPDGRSILTASADATVRLWELPDGPLTAASAKLWACLLSHRHVDATGGSVRSSLAVLRTAWESLKDNGRVGNQVELEELLAWHFEEASVHLKQRAWARAVRHLDAIIESRPRDFSFRKRRAAACAELGDLEKAAGDYEAALALGSGDINDGYNAAVTRLGSGNLEAYHRTCEDLLARSAGMEPTARTATNVALACVLAPGRTAEHPAVIGLAEHLLSLQPQAAWSHFILGAAHLRAGHAAQSVSALKQAIQLAGGSGEPLAQCFLPLALDVLGEKEAARQALRAAQEACSQYLRSEESATPGSGVPWWRRIRLKTLLEEAERQLGLPAAPGKREDGLLVRLKRSIFRVLERKKRTEEE